MILYFLIAFALGWLCCLSGVMVGGLLVYRTKREAWEPGLLSRKTKPGEIIDNDPVGEAGFSEQDVSPLPPTPLTLNDVKKSIEDTNAIIMNDIIAQRLRAEGDQNA